MESGNELSSSLSFASSSYVSNGCSSSPQEPGPSLDHLCASLEKLLLNPEYDYSDAEIVVEGISVGVNRCILAARSQFFHKKFKKNENSLKDEKPKYLPKDLVPFASIGYEIFMVFLNYLYTEILSRLLYKFQVVLIMLVLMMLATLPLIVQWSSCMLRPRFR